jgi:STELLO glycosyltransferases
LQTLAPKTAVVITTINAPTKAVVDFAEGAGPHGVDVVLIGDEKSPRDFAQDGARYFSLEAQRDSGFTYGRIAPARHYARKNVGYLEAVRAGAQVIVDTDDDNIPLDSFWAPRTPHLVARRIDGASWVNVYAYFTDVPIWPRGLPLDRVRQLPPSLTTAAASVYCPIQQGLANENPDVDAIYRLILPLPVDFRDEAPVALGPGTWCPFNSQNTTSFPDAFPLLYLPYHCSFRMTDIWRSFVAQRIAHVNGWAIGFHKATVYQVRNEHNLMRDFEDEVPGYLHNEKIRTALDALDLPAGSHKVPQAMHLCYRKLVDMGLVGDGELVLLDAFLADLGGLS